MLHTSPGLISLMHLDQSLTSSFLTCSPTITSHLKLFLTLRTFTPNSLGRLWQTRGNPTLSSFSKVSFKVILCQERFSSLCSTLSSSTSKHTKTHKVTNLATLPSLQHLLLTTSTSFPTTVSSTRSSLLTLKARLLLWAFLSNQANADHSPLCRASQPTSHFIFPHRLQLTQW